MTEVWNIEYFSDSVADEIYHLPIGLRVCYFKLADRIKIYGPNLGVPHSKSLGNGLYELRLKAKEGIARVIFMVQKGRLIIILSSFIKKTDKIPRNELEKALERQKKILKYGRL